MANFIDRGDLDLHIKKKLYTNFFLTVFMSIIVIFSRYFYFRSICQFHEISLSKPIQYKS